MLIAEAQVRAQQEAEAKDPTTAPARLRALASSHPLDVATNPNSDPQTLNDLLALSKSTSFIDFAICWSILEENPSLPMLLLEDPAHQLPINVRYVMAKARLDLNLTYLDKPDRITVFVEAFKRQLPWMRKIHGVATRKFKAGLLALLTHAGNLRDSAFTKWHGVNIGHLVHGNDKNAALFNSLGIAYQRGSVDQLAGSQTAFIALANAMAQQRTGRASTGYDAQSVEWRACVTEINNFFSDLLERYLGGERFPWTIKRSKSSK
jgi:hypothetical protein